MILEECFSTVVVGVVVLWRGGVLSMCCRANVYRDGVVGDVL